MPTPSNPRAVVLSSLVYRGLLRAYPRRFQLQYREEMALVFRDCCRTAHRERGALGLVPVWGGALADLVKNAPGEHATRLIERSDAAGSVTRSCSGCYSEVEPDWRVCKVCGEPLVEGATHVTRAIGPHPSFASDVEHVIDQVRKVPPGGAL
jgi:hypothetical protein